MRVETDELMGERATRDLARAVALTRDEHDAAALLVDLCTEREISDLAQRLEVARLLDAGESYLAVQQATGASSTTVSRVSKFLNGKAGGYRHVLGLLDG